MFSKGSAVFLLELVLGLPGIRENNTPVPNAAFYINIFVLYHVSNIF